MSIDPDSHEYLMDHIKNLRRRIDDLESRPPTTGTRDWFAGMALQGLRVGDWTDCKDGAKYCYDYADAMIQEREKK